MKLIFEFKPKSKYIVFLPSIVLFLRGSEGDFIDLTFAWIIFGVTIRFGEKKRPSKNG